MQGHNPIVGNGHRPAPTETLLKSIGKQPAKIPALELGREGSLLFRHQGGPCGEPPEQTLIGSFAGSGETPAQQNIGAACESLEIVFKLVADRLDDLLDHGKTIGCIGGIWSRAGIGLCKALKIFASQLLAGGTETDHLAALDPQQKRHHLAASHRDAETIVAAQRILATRPGNAAPEHWRLLGGIIHQGRHAQGIGPKLFENDRVRKVKEHTLRLQFSAQTLDPGRDSLRGDEFFTVVVIHETSLKIRLRV